MKIVDVFQTDRAWALVRLDDGRLVAAGQGGTASAPDFALARFHPDGTLDTSFGTGGVVVADFAGGFDVIYGLAVQSDGKLVAAGTVESVDSADIAVARYLPDGDLDPTFGDGGLVTVDVAVTDKNGQPVTGLTAGDFKVEEEGVPQAITSFQAVQLGDKPQMEKLIGAIKAQLDAYTNGEVDAVYLAYSRFINTMKQEPVIEQLLPLAAERLAQSDAEKRAYGWDYIYEPGAKEVVDELLVRYVEALVYQAVAENMASEQSARMVAMKAASDNAKNVIGELQLVYNKTRQAAITKELAEIVGGAAAV